MGIEDPIWGRVIIVLFFITILLMALYFSKYRGREFFSKLSNNEFLRLDETISLSNVSKASLITAYNQKFLIIHGKGQSASISHLPLDNEIRSIKAKHSGDYSK